MVKAREATLRHTPRVERADRAASRERISRHLLGRSLFGTYIR